MSDWQPIETAPTDGREILGLFLSGGIWCVRIMWYYTKEDYDLLQPEGTIEENVGWWSMISSVSQHYVKPTHWIPLPEYPADEPNKL